jgi:hypothetical protein
LKQQRRATGQNSFARSYAGEGKAVSGAAIKDLHLWSATVIAKKDSTQRKICRRCGADERVWATTHTVFSIAWDKLFPKAEDLKEPERVGRCFL